jgi:hypothetical protein
MRELAKDVHLLRGWPPLRDPGRLAEFVAQLP